MYMKQKKKLMIANWKMNPVDGKTAVTWFKKIQQYALKNKQHVETVVCPPAVYLQSLQSVITDRACVLGAQDCFWENSGSFTGEISPEMIFNAKARYVIIGHSERRNMGETSEIINKKILTILQFPLSVIVCVGEKKRSDNGAHFKEIKKQITEALSGVSIEQMHRVVIAYEPIWAIGGSAIRSATWEESFEMITVIRRIITDLYSADIGQEIFVLYGGSTNVENSKDFLTIGGADGLLVGRASLDSKEFGSMITIANKLSY
jgi:triosephosphate isomerase (TIM)